MWKKRNRQGKPTPPESSSPPPARPPPFAFLKGAVAGLVLLVPLTALAVYLLGLVGIGDPHASYPRVIAFVAVFAGVPAIVSAGGIARAVAQAAVATDRGPDWSLFIAILDTAMLGSGLAILTVVPLGEVPAGFGRWLWILGLGAAAGALGGLVLGLWVSHPVRTAT